MAAPFVGTFITTLGVFVFGASADCADCTVVEVVTGGGFGTTGIVGEGPNGEGKNGNDGAGNEAAEVTGKLGGAAEGKLNVGNAPKPGKADTPCWIVEEPVFASVEAVVSGEFDWAGAGAELLAAGDSDERELVPTSLSIIAVRSDSIIPLDGVFDVEEGEEFSCLLQAGPDITESAKKS